MFKNSLPKKIPIFPLSNFIIFPKTTVPLNIFEPRYIEMINDSMKTNKLIGMIQPKISKDKNEDYIPQLHQIGCMGKITTFKETEDSRYLIELKGLIRFKIVKEINSNKKYRECEVNFENFYEDLENKYKILKINKSQSFTLRSSNLRSYYYKNIIAFGDLLHRLHPLAGQGFNMTIRDIRELLSLIQFRKEHGLDLDASICMDFEKNTKNKNYLFSSGVDFIYEFFNLENKINYNNFSKSIKFFDI